MTTQQIKSAVNQGKVVHWSNEAYTVIKDKLGQYLIKCDSNNHCIGLTWDDDVTLNGEEEDFYIKNN